MKCKKCGYSAGFFNLTRGLCQKCRDNYDENSNLSSPPSADDLQRITSTATDEIKEKWLKFDETLPFKEGVPLSKKIDLFVQPVQEFISNKYPIVLTGPPDIFWLIIFNAILESGTHPKDEVNLAINELSKKYAH